MKKVIVTGSGQLAWELNRTCPKDVELISLTRAQLDISNASQIEAAFEKYQPDALINAAAYTAVDKAEADGETAKSVNTHGAQFLAEQCEKHGCYLLHISTDFVFDGSANRPYAEDDKKNPIGVYGQTKSDGEDEIARVLSDGWAVIRTAWVYSSHGNNFVKTMLRLMAEKPALSVVGDQIGTPTWAKGLALACWSAVSVKAQGTYHWTDAGVASWYDFAVAIQRIAFAQGVLEEKIPVASIPTEAYPTPAKRPAYSVLDKRKILDALPVEPRHWQDQLETMLAELNELA